MRIHPLLLAMGFSGLVLAGGICFAADPSSDTQSFFNLDRRVPWTASNVKGSPDPPPPYRVEVAFPLLKFTEPLALTRAPGSDRLFVAERYGKIFSFTNDPDTAESQLLLDVGKTTYGLTFHPNFPNNGYFYVTYMDTLEESPHGTHVSRFQVIPDNPLHCDPATEKVIFEWQSGGHNGGCIKFGHDGFLYIATGDAAGIADTHLNGQNVGTLPSSILRIDVDHPDPDKSYGIPKDNPFVDLADARPEIWAYGLRQPWRMSFDRASGDLWLGDVGQDLWEMVQRIERGGNYGWSVAEGTHPFRPERPRGPTPILPPVVEHDHAAFRSITGGFVYHGTRLAELRGAYIYGDYDTGRIWMLRYNREQGKVVESGELVDSSLRLVGFGEDHAGELYLVDHTSGRIFRLVPNRATANVDFPRRLSETGIFASVADHRPAAGLIPYSVTAPQWIDGAVKERYIGLPGQSQIEFEKITYPQPAPGAPAGWKFPDGTVLVETLSLEMEKGNPASRRRLETRILHHERLAGGELASQVGDQYWRGYTYVWNEEQTDAVLLEDPQGRDEVLAVKDSAAPGGQRRQTWHYPSRVECTTCHNMAAKYVLGVQTHQMNKNHDYGQRIASQLQVLQQLGAFTKPLPQTVDKLDRLADYRDDTQDLNLRARSYLHANCSHCHRKWGGGNAEFQLLATLSLADMGVQVRPGQGAFQISHARVLAAGEPYRSVMYYRMARVGPGRMPRLGSNVTDDTGVQLIHEWISQLPPGDAELKQFAARADAEFAADLNRLRVVAHAGDARAKVIDKLLTSTDASMRLARAIEQQALPSDVREQVLAQATKHPAGEIRDLFERFLPEQQRTKRLGNIVKTEQILSLPGDIQAGKSVFFATAGVQCKNCHKIQGQGTDIGPDLSEIGSKYPRAELLDTILNPSQKIEPKYLLYVVETTAGRVHSGLLLQKDELKVVLMTAENKQIQIKAEDVELMVPQQKSMMPDLLLREMTAQQVADLTAYLSSLNADFRDGVTD